MARTLIAPVRAWFSNPVIARGSLVFLNSVVIAAGGLAFWLVAAKRFAPEVVGVATAATGALVFLSGLGQLGLGVGLIRHQSASQLGRLTVWTVFLTTGAVTAALAAAFLGLASRLSSDIAAALGAPGNRWIFVGACAAWAISIQFDQYLLSRLMTRWLLVKNTIVSASRLLVVIVARAADVVLLVAATGAAGLVGTLAVLIPAVRRQTPPERMTPVSVRSFVGYSLWNHLATVVGAAPILLMPSIVLWLAGPIEAAAYYIAWSMYWGTAMVSAAAAQALLITSVAHERVPIVRAPRSRRAWGAIGASSLAFIGLACVVLSLFGSSYFSRGSPVILALAPALVPYHLSLLHQTRLRLGSSQREYALIYVTGHMAMLLVGFLLVPVLGGAGGGLAWTLGQSLLAWSLVRVSGAAT